MNQYDPGVPIWSRLLDAARPAQGYSPDGGWILPAGLSRKAPPENAPEGCPLPYDWETRTYAALDVETTGLDAYRDRIVEIGILLFSFDGEGAFREESAWQSLINPGISIPPSATAIHGITDLEISSAPFFRSVISDIESLLAGRVLVAHNAPFDVSFVRQEFMRAQTSFSDIEAADTLMLSRMAFPSFHSHSLGKLAFLLQLEKGTSHRALDDARTCSFLFAQCARTLTGACP